MRDNDAFWGVGFFAVATVVIIAALLLIFGVHWQTSEDLVSGIVYNNTNNDFISGNTDFSVRAAVDTYVSDQNTSSFCLPPNSPYIPLVKEAAADKSIKVVVATRKEFKLLAPWSCMANVTVTKEK